jgi:release factor glutamine methyltransferase
MAAPTIRELFANGVAELEKLGVESAASEVKLLLSDACGASPAEAAFSDRAATAEETERFRWFLRRRLGGEPVQYVLGHAYFYDLDLEVSPAVLIPRPETEVLVDRVLEKLPEGGALLDLGTGSGAIALSVARRRRDARVTAADVSEAALEVARRNASRIGAEVEFVLSDLFSGLAGRRFDVVAANLPYVPEEDRPLLAPEVALREPAVALFAPDGGFAVIGRALKALPEHLVPGGFAIFELDPRQAARAAETLERLGFAAGIRRDLAGRERFAEGVKR